VSGELRDARRVVVKIGSSLLTNAGAGLDRDAIAGWVGQIAGLRARGVEVLVVSSGAIAEGMKRLGWTRRPHAVHELQAAAAVGQMGLVQMWESCFAQVGTRTAQVLLTHEDLGDRRRYLNARTTLRSLLALGVVPVINENDTVVVEEIRFGDNDTLGALVTNLIEADALAILTDQKGLYSADPRRVPGAQLIERGAAGDPALEAMAGGAGSALGTPCCARRGARRAAARTP
jgi:glutamate 5-kinase